MESFLRSVVDANTIEDVWAHHTVKMAEYGFDRLLYGFTRNKTSSGLGSKDDFLILSNHEPEYTAGFIDQDLYSHAPMVKWAAKNDGACSWRHVLADPANITPQEQRVIDFNRSFGVQAGYSISFRDISIRNKGAIGLTAKIGMSQDDADAVWETYGRDLIVMNTIVHMKLIGLPHAAASQSLTPRQREVLEWVRDGKTAQEIATIMGLTTATIEKHLRLARASLDVETTAQAVLKASLQNQIFVLGA